MTRVGILTYGCSVNRSDSELMATLLAEAGFQPELETEDPLLIIVNTCIVKGPTENKIIRKLQDLEKAGKRVIITGCMPAAYPSILKRFKGFAVLGVNGFDIVETVNDYLKGNRHGAQPGFKEKVLPKSVRYNKFVEIIPISEGCLGACAYCATKIARGGLRSYSPAAVIGAAKAAVNSGAREIWLTSQDNGCYGFDLRPRTNLAELLRAITEIPGDFRVRVGMMNPGHLGGPRGFLDDLIEAYKSPRVFKFAHIPVQAGSNKVLKEMKRGYTAEEFEGIVARFRSGLAKTGVTISTDIIAGFPTETEEDFKETLSLLKRTEPDFLNLSRYWPRKGTPAGGMKQLPRDVVAERSKKAADFYSKSLKGKNKAWIGKECSVKFTEERNGYFVGRNYLYRPVLVKGKNLLGKACSVKITASRKSELIGHII